LSLSDVRFAKEKLTPQLAEEALPLLQAHVGEVSFLGQDAKLDVDWGRYSDIQEAGAFHVYTARTDGRLVGYIAYLVMFHLHYQWLKAAMQDVIYLAPESRRGRTAMEMIKFSEDSLREEGVDVVFQHGKLSKDLTKLFKLLRYTPMDVAYMKWLNSED